MTKLILSIDTTNILRAERLINQVNQYVDMYKIGLEFFIAHGRAGIKLLNVPVFLDLKFHDIPTTVNNAIRAIAPIYPKMITLHASGDVKMMREARMAANEFGINRPKLLAVTILTSLDQYSLTRIGINNTVDNQVINLAQIALDEGMDGIVCSSHELKILREKFGDKPLLITPGIRPVGVETNDQVRIMTPRAAMMAGADWIVVGRPITQAFDPGIAAKDILQEIS